MDDFKILIVEDDPVSLQVINMIAKKYSLSLKSAINGKLGFEAYQEFNPDLVISDISMPVMNGLVMSQKIREINQDVPIILASALNEADVLTEAIQIGVSEYIIKPLDTAKLRQIIDRIKQKHFIQKDLEEKNKYLQLFSAALDYTNSPVIILNQHFEIEFVNIHFENLFLRTREELVNHNIYSFFKEKDRLKFQEIIKDLEVNKNGKSEFFFVNQKGVRFWLILNITSIHNEKSNQIYYVIITEDITQSKTEEENLLNSNTLLESKIRERTLELEIAKEKAEASSQAKGLFLAKVSHELRTPLNGILGITDILLDTEINEKQKKFLNLLKHSGKSLLRLINDVLDFTKIESDKITLKLVNFDLNEITDELTNLYVNELKLKELKLITNFDSNIPQKLYGDGKKLKQILTNILGNAIKFTLNGSVVFSTKFNELESGFSILFTIEDSGIGIPEDKFDLLFKSFSQVDDNLTRSFEGSGLGLAISKEFVELMEGKIWFESKVGVGTKFFIEIPFDSV